MSERAKRSLAGHAAGLVPAGDLAQLRQLHERLSLAALHRRLGDLGRRLWSVENGGSAYLHVNDERSRLVIIRDGGVLIYEVVGVDLRAA